MPLPSTEADSVDAICVVETGVFSFGCVQVAVERVDFLPNLKDEISLEKLSEVLRVCLSRLRKHVLVDELVYWAALHLDRLLSALRGSREAGQMSEAMVFMCCYRSVMMLSCTELCCLAEDVVSC